MSVASAEMLLSIRSATAVSREYPRSRREAVRLAALGGSCWNFAISRSSQVRHTQGGPARISSRRNSRSHASIPQEPARERTSDSPRTRTLFSRLCFPKSSSDVELILLYLHRGREGCLLIVLMTQVSHQFGSIFSGAASSYWQTTTCRPAFQRDVAWRKLLRWANLRRCKCLQSSRR